MSSCFYLLQLEFSVTAEDRSVLVCKVAFGLHLNITEETESPFVKAMTTAMQGIQNSFKAPWKEVSKLSFPLKMVIIIVIYQIY